MLETTPVESNVQNTRNSIKLAQSRTNQDTVQAGDTRSTGSKQANVFGSLSYRNNPSQEVMINSEINNDMEAQQLNFDDYTNKTSNLELDSLKVIENQQRKVKKRLQLKNLIITKFRNKYDASASNEDDVNNVIQEEVDNLFSQDQFDERDLVTVDRKIRTFIQHKKDKQLQKESKQLPDDAKTEISNSKRATIATARLLDGGCKEDLTGTRSKIGTLADLQTRATVSRLPKNSTVMPLTLDGDQNGSLRSFRQKLASHAGSRSFSNNQLSTQQSEIRRMMGTTGNVKRPQDIFDPKGSWGVSDTVQEKNKLASQMIHKRLLNGGGSITTKNASPLQAEFDFEHVKRGNTASYSHAPSTDSQSKAMMFIKARQDDYWNKIAQYNYKLFQLERDEAKQKKMFEQAQLRQLLQQQMDVVSNNRCAEVKSDRDYMVKLQEQLTEKERAAQAERNEKRLHLQNINQDRTAQQQHTLSQWKSERKQQHEYHNEVMKNNKEKEVEEQNIRGKLFQARLQAAKENAEKFHKIKADEKLQRDQEKAQFSPLHPRGAAPREPASPAEAGADEAKSPYSTSQHFNTLKAPAPMYDDFLNDLFANKRHQAYARCARQEKRTQVIQDKFKENWSNSGKVEFDRKIHDAYIKMNEDFSNTMDQRKNTRERLANATKDFQKKQMRDKTVQSGALQRKKELADECERKRLEHVDAMARRTMQEQKDRLQANQAELFRQMDQRQVQAMGEDLMHRIDYKLNSKLIRGLEQPVLAPKEKRKPF